MRKPVTPTMCSGVNVAAHKRAMFPVLGGISGSTRAMFGIIHGTWYVVRNTQYAIRITYQQTSKYFRQMAFHVSVSGLWVSSQARARTHGLCESSASPASAL